MKTSILTGALIALLTGIAITVQSTLATKAGSLMGDLKTGMMTNIMGGLVAVVMMLISILWWGREIWKVPVLAVGLTAGSGLLGVFIVTGISFSLQRAGIAAGLASVILGQLALSFLMDAWGWGGGDPIPLSFSRVLGLVITGLGVYLLLPKT